MIDEKKVQEMNTLTGERAHNALAAAVGMYQSILEDVARERRLMQATVQALRDSAEALGRKVKEQQATIENSRVAYELLAAQLRAVPPDTGSNSMARGDAPAPDGG